MSQLNIDSARAVKRWSPILESLGINSPEKKAWMAEYAEFHSYAHNNGFVSENVAYNTNATTVGMGAIISPTVGSVPGSFDPSTGAAAGSGDLGQSLLPVSMKIAAQTIGLDLIPTKPTSGPAIDLAFLDIKYEDTLGDEGYDNPILFAVEVAAASTLNAKLRDLMAAAGVRERVGGLDKRMFIKFTSGAGYTAVGAARNYSTTDTSLATSATSKKGMLEFLGFSRVTGLPMFRAFRQNNAVSRGNRSFNANANTFDEADTLFTVLSNAKLVTPNSADDSADVDFLVSKLENISAMEDQIPGFVSNWNTHAMNRKEDDTFYPGVMAPSMKVQRIGVGTIEISSALKRNEIEDIKAQTGIDIVAKMEGVLVNELSQFISKEIVAAIFTLGEKNRLTTPLGADGTKKFDFDTAYAAAAALGGETSHHVARKLVSRIKNAQNFIAVDGRVGPAEYIVTNGNLASILADNSTYTTLPVNDVKFNAPGQMYPYGKVAGMTIYVDPYMSYNDNRLVLGRKNKPEEGGLVFVPYLMAQSLTLISEATWAPRMMLRSRYAVAEVGYYPWKHYLSIHVSDAAGLLG